MTIPDRRREDHDTFDYDEEDPRDYADPVPRRWKYCCSDGMCGADDCKRCAKTLEPDDGGDEENE